MDDLLDAAAVQGDVGEVDRILKLGVVNSCGPTIQECANALSGTAQGRKIIGLLVQYDEKCGRSWTEHYNEAMRIAAERGDMEMMMLLCDETNNVALNDALGAAAGRGHTDIVHRLLALGADDYAIAGYGAARGGHRDIVSHILQLMRLRSQTQGALYDMQSDLRFILAGAAMRNDAPQAQSDDDY